jgi:hypothetical protein
MNSPDQTKTNKKNKKKLTTARDVYVGSDLEKTLTLRAKNTNFIKPEQNI